MNVLYQAFSFLSKAERKRGLVVVAMAVVMAVFEAGGVASLMPFLAVLGNPDAISTGPFLQKIHTLSGRPDTDRFLFVLGLGAFILLIVTAVVRMATHYAINRYTQMRVRSIGERLFETYLRQPYAFFLNRHSGDLATRILSESNQVVATVYKPLLTMLANAVTMSAIISMLVLLDPLAALLVGSILGVTYGVIYASVRQCLTRIGKDQVAANRARFAVTSDAMHGIKVIKTSGREFTYLMRYRDAAITSARMQAANMTLGQLPKFAIEAIAFGGIILLCLVLMARHGGAGSDAIGQVLPLIGLYTFAGYRLLPTLQAFYRSLTQFRFGAAAIDSVYRDTVTREHLPKLAVSLPAKMGLHDSIEIDELSYSYPNTDSTGVHCVNLKIHAGALIGVVGSTGAGKTTLVDLLLGLLRPQTGRIRVDGTEVSPENIRSWQQTIGYVPQEIFLIDATIAENIAFGYPPEEIDYGRVKDCARMAQVYEFIANELTGGFDARIGERGVRLSGGQRQRLGIARALYSDPDLIVFDEATSALDNLTEKEIMKSVGLLSRRKTIVMIAHRMSTVQGCDTIIVLDKGRVAAQGPYDTLLSENEQFRAIAVPA